MKIIVLIACVGSKKSSPCAALDLYDSAWFKKARDYAKSLRPDKIYILSAKYGLVDSAQILEWYDETLNNMKSKQRKAWAEKVLSQMSAAGIHFDDKVFFLAGKKYRENLIHKFSNAEVPLRGLGIGKQMQFMDKALNACSK
jgi:hypothetical protein